MCISDDWASAIDAYLAYLRSVGRSATTVRARREQLQHLARRVEVGPWALDADGLTDYLGAQEWARETRRSRSAGIAGFYAWAVRRGHVEASPADELVPLRPAEPMPRPVPDRVYLEALIRADADEALWIDLAAEHGLRRAEVAGIHSNDIVPTLLGHDLIVHGKGGKLRTVPLTRPMARALLERGPGFLFPGEDGGHVSPRWLGKRVGRLLAGDYTMHKLRHRAATRFWVLADGDPYAVADLMGWANLNMVRVYVAQPDGRLRRIVEGASRSGDPLVKDPLTLESRTVAMH
ncbi:tyrosine-type recombinase/integrase [Agromyces larvae]|uniref:Tyrosine-type recombinase/integrase n=1 Tax=Agromyces larvae TaxID=2929802 RepID=A0ABY4C1C1_9MICO|nr:tyrosine-type recombinase/integrase [Agromyces larvae]UOE43753.1 tyrosine-type recombinase/integrase [Agromyces larvae]